MPVELKSPCANCGQSNFQRESTLFGLVQVLPEGIKPDTVCPVVVITCGDCGALRLFHAKITGDA